MKTASGSRRSTILALLMAWLLGLFIGWLLFGGGDGPHHPICEASTSSVASTGSLVTSEQTGCDEAANRHMDDAERAAAYQEAKLGEFPPSVVSNPVECLNPMHLEDSQIQVPGSVQLGDHNDNLDYATYVDAELLSFLDPERLQVGLDAVGAGTAAALLERVALDGFDVDFSMFGTAAVPTHLYHYKLDAGARGIADPLRLSNQLLQAGYHARPNYVIALAPGSQHSPANEPVPAHTKDLFVGERFDDGIDIKVAVLDSNQNADPSGKTSANEPMHLWAGHMRFVSGVIEQLAPDVTVEEISFEAGEELKDSPLLTDWALYYMLTRDGVLVGVDALNLSAGAYTCALPELDDPRVEDHAPPGMLAAVELLESKKILLIAAAGNDGLPTEDGRGFWPAAFADSVLFDHAVVGVKATKIVDGSDRVADFSNELPIAAVCAPGVDIRSKFPTGQYEYADGTVGKFEGAAIWSGTSFATPHITAEYARWSAENGDDYLGAAEYLRDMFPCR